MIGNFIYDPNKIIGYGSFGTVAFHGYLHRGDDLGVDTPVAIKRVPKSHIEDDASLIQQEEVLMKKAGDHPAILKCISTEMTDDHLYDIYSSTYILLHLYN